MKKETILYVAVLAFLLLFCLYFKSDNKRYTDKLAEEIEEGFSNDELEKYETIVLIPESGCTGCISEAENFFLKNKEKTNILFLFTKFQIEKDLKLKLRINSLNSSNIFLDKENRYYLSKYDECKYPVVISLRKGKVYKIDNPDFLFEEVIDPI